jgi:Skp family chaperone for outer membrane proteins
MNTPNNDIPNAAYSSATVDQCTSTCNNTSDCYGFVFDNQNNVCYPKTNGMYPYGSGTTNIDNTLDIYVRQKQPLTVPNGVSNKTVNIDTIKYQNYVNGGALSNQYGLANATSEQQKKLNKLQNKLNNLSSQISTLTKKYEKGQSQSTNQSTKNLNGLNNYNIQRSNIEKQIQNMTGNNNNNNNNSRFKENFSNNISSIERIVQESDIVVLQKNYEYLFWTILAAASVIVAINIGK